MTARGNLGSMWNEYQLWNLPSDCLTGTHGPHANLHGHITTLTTPDTRSTRMPYYSLLMYDHQHMPCMDGMQLSAASPPCCA